jgi:hypothetical protein
MTDFVGSLHPEEISMPSKGKRKLRKGPAGEPGANVRNTIQRSCHQ